MYGMPIMRAAAARPREYRRRLRGLAVMTGVLWAAALSTEASANFCGKGITQRARSEAQELLAERFALPTDVYGGDTSYNELVIACNRARDTKGNEIEKEITARHDFPADLPPRTVKGHFNYFGQLAAGLRYAYQLERNGNQWTVTIPMRFHWPEDRLTGSIDISRDLAQQLGLSATGGICDPGQVRRSVDGVISQGFIRAARAGEDVTGIGDRDVGFKDSACRVPRTLSVAGKNMLEQIQGYWKAEIERVWNRPGFGVRPVVFGIDEVSAAELAAWEKDETVWNLHLNLDPSHRAGYKRFAFKWNHMYSGVPGYVVAHEVGHVMGLDDEYAEKQSVRNCDVIDPTDNYLMCSSSFGAVGADEAAGAQGVYPWLITRRYAVARERQCTSNRHCGTDEYCATRGLNRNVCQAQRQEGDRCTLDDQCVGGTTCDGAPLAGRCLAPAVFGIGDQCDRDVQCRSGSCNGDGRCQCNTSFDCDDGSYCDTGVGSFGKNQCLALKAEGATCGDDKQCLAPARCTGLIGSKRCIVESSKTLGDRCVKDAECRIGKCGGASNTCECRRDGDCPGDQKCREPIGKPNYCERS
jgi:hypothetical protein